MPEKSNPLTFDGDAVLDRGVAWYLKHDDGHKITVFNPRMEPDEDNSLQSEWDGNLLVDDREMTAEEADEYTLDVIEFLRQQDWRD